MTTNDCRIHGYMLNICRFYCFVVATVLLTYRKQKARVFIQLARTENSAKPNALHALAHWHTHTNTHSRTHTRSHGNNTFDSIKWRDNHCRSFDIHRMQLKYPTILYGMCVCARLTLRVLCHLIDDFTWHNYWVEIFRFYRRWANDKISCNYSKSRLRRNRNGTNRIESRFNWYKIDTIQYKNVPSIVRFNGSEKIDRFNVILLNSEVLKVIFLKPTTLCTRMLFALFV